MLLQATQQNAFHPFPRCHSLCNLWQGYNVWDFGFRALLFYIKSSAFSCKFNFQYWVHECVFMNWYSNNKCPIPDIVVMNVCFMNWYSAPWYLNDIVPLKYIHCTRYLFSSFSLHNPADYTPSVEDQRYQKQSMQSPLSSLAPSSTCENRFSLLALLFDFSLPYLSESALN